ncbi:complement factor D-like [Ostrinia furnacalis]|uniref:complement factor D-like n=1 Tax=Ostrinia furnacalis TaxID=93504 RepID=UPI0010402715|nr:complement factor D-like [Ostrinia furnacalis]
MDVRLLLLFSLLTGADFQEAVEAECCSNDVDGTQQDTADQTTEVAEFQDLLELEAACPELSGQIIGGRPSSVTRHPYQVSMVLNGNSFCGGFIISPSYVLTAAHCVQK